MVTDMEVAQVMTLMITLKHFTDFSQEASQSQNKTTLVNAVYEEMMRNIGIYNLIVHAF